MDEPINHVWQTGETYTFKPRALFCPKHGEVTRNVNVVLGIPMVDGLYCLKCYAENVIVPNCERLTEAPAEYSSEPKP